MISASPSYLMAPCNYHCLCLWMCAYRHGISCSRVCSHCLNTLKLFLLVFHSHSTTLRNHSLSLFRTLSLFLPFSFFYCLHFSLPVSHSYCLSLYLFLSHLFTVSVSPYLHLFLYASLSPSFTRSLLHLVPLSFRSSGRCWGIIRHSASPRNRPCVCIRV